MGAQMSKSKTIARQITDVISTVVVEHASTSTGAAIGQQEVLQQDIGGNAYMEDVDISALISLDLKTLSDQTTQTSVQNDITNKLKAFAESTVKGQTFGLQSVNMETLTESITKISNNIKVKDVSGCYANAASNQSAKQIRVAENAYIKNLKMETAVSTVSNCILQQSSVNEATLDLANELASQSTIKIAGIDITTIFIVLIVLLVIGGAAYIIFRRRGGASTFNLKLA